VNNDPLDAKAYFSRHRAWMPLGRNDLALADLDKAPSIEAA
jgi:hypothetical protein